MKLFSTKGIILLLALILIALIVFMIWQRKTTYQAVNFETIYIEDAPAQIYAQYEQQKTQTGFSTITYDNHQYVLITVGPVKTGGYDLEVNKVYKTKGKIIIEASLLAPDPNSFVTQAISYPAIVVKLPQITTQIEVIVDGKIYPQL